MTRADLLALAARVEQAAGADRELDAEVLLACGVVTSRDGNLFFGHKDHSALVMERDYYDREGDAPALPSPTGSLDAAVSLVPEGCLYFARTLWDETNKAGYACVSHYTPGLSRTFINDTAGVAATPALALTAAALRARAEEASDE